MSKSLIGIFLDAVATFRRPDQFLRKRDGRWETISGERALRDVEELGLGLAALGVGPGDRVAILSETRYEWAIADLAILGLGAVTVPIYTTLTAEQCHQLLERAAVRLAVVSNEEQLAKIRAAFGALPELQAVVMEPGSGEEARVRSWSAVAALGAEARSKDAGAFRRTAEAVGPDDLATIIFTSGTTGEPKGAMLTHGNIAFDVESCMRVIDLNPNDASLSFLPLSHIFERMAGLYAMLAAGARIGYAQSLDTVAADALEVRPTVMMGVPRFYEKVVARIFQTAAAFPRLKRALFDWGVRQGVRRARARFAGRPGDSLAARVADRLVLAPIRARLGGRLRFAISGGAPLSADTMEFFFAIGVPVIEGYGHTETSPVICLNVPGRERPGSVGPPIPGVEVRIAESGEILTRGPHVMRGYFRNEQATREALADGWFHTGDVGHLDAEGRLVITDRLKDLIVTAGGKKVAPQPLENRLRESPWIAEAILVGDRRPYVVALLVPDFGKLEAEAKARGWAADSRAALLAHPEVLAHYQREIETLNVGLAPFERIKRFSLLERELSQEAGEITPTLKVRRRIVGQKFGEVIERLYAGHALPAST